MLKEGMRVKIGMYEKNIVYATVTAILEDKIIAHCSYFQKSYYLSFKKEDINSDFEVLEYDKL